MDEDLIIAMATTIVLSTIKNPAKKTKIKKAMAKIVRSILGAYAGDAEFQQLVNPVAPATHP